MTYTFFHERRPIVDDKIIITKCNVDYYYIKTNNPYSIIYICTENNDFNDYNFTTYGVENRFP
jgi:hypothetical protein